MFTIKRLTFLFRFLFALFIFISVFSFTPKSFADTPISGTIFTDDTWTKENSPYIVSGNFTVSPGRTLTIDPGVIVKFQDIHSNIFVDGDININGTAADKIYFTSIKDDTVGGDTNGDGDGTTPDKGDWNLLYIRDSSISYISNLVLRYAGSNGYPGLFNYGGTVIMSDSVITQNMNAGYLQYVQYPQARGSATITNTELSHNTYGIFLNGGVLHISDSIIKDNSVSGAFNFSDYWSPPATFNAVNNFWGDPTGPLHPTLNPAGLGNAITNDIFFSPWLSVYPPPAPNAICTVDCFYGPISDSPFNLYYPIPARLDPGGTRLTCDSPPYNGENFGSYRIGTYPGGGQYFSGSTRGTGACTGSLNAPDNIVNAGVNYLTLYASLDTTVPYGFIKFFCTAPVLNAGDCVIVDLTPEPPLPPRNPVIIIPGVLGTEISRPTESGPEKLWLDLLHNLTDLGDEFMDPLQFNADLTPTDASLTLGDVVRRATLAVFSYDYSEALVNDFQTQGYIEGTDLFLFPYDWRYGVSEDSIDKLKQKITDVLAQSDAEKVDIIAHSTGGLLAKKYVVENPLENHIDKAVFVGVPNTGAPKAIKALIQGDGFGNYFLSDNEMKKLSKNLPVAYDLSPSEQYFNVKGSYVKIIELPLFAHTPKNLSFEEANSFLIDDHQLNNQALTNAHTLHTAEFDNYDLRTAGVDLYSVNGCKTGTIGKVVEVHQDPAFADPFSSPNQLEQAPSYQLENTPGDGTVPFESATNLPINEINKYYGLQASHGKMLSQDGIRQQIVNILSGSTLSTKDSSNRDLITQDISKCKLKGRAVSVFSPLSIDVIDQDGNHSGFSSDGVSIENNIPNADFQIIGEHKFVYLPTDEGQTYTISVAGTGTGVFTLTDATIDENNIIQTQVFSNIAVTPNLLGHITLSDNTTLSLDNDGNGIVDQTLTPTSVLNATESQNFVPPQPSANNGGNNNPPQNNSSGGAPVVSGSGGLVATVVVANNNTANTTVEKKDDKPVLLPPILKNTEEAPVETPAEIIITKQENNSDIVAPAQKTEDEKSLFDFSITPGQAENLPEGAVPLMPLAGSKPPIKYQIIIGGLAGISILLLAKKFLKV